LPDALPAAEARQRLIPELKKLDVLQLFGAQRVFECIFALYDSGAAFGMAELDARLEDDDRMRLASIALSHETNEANVSLQKGLACLEKLSQHKLETQISVVKTSIKDAERSGNLPEAFRLNDELARLQNRRGQTFYNDALYNDRDQ
jgi:hypothetical protein